MLLTKEQLMWYKMQGIDVENFYVFSCMNIVKRCVRSIGITYLGEARQFNYGPKIYMFTIKERNYKTITADQIIYYMRLTLNNTKNLENVLYAKLYAKHIQIRQLDMLVKLTNPDIEEIIRGQVDYAIKTLENRVI